MSCFDYGVLIFALNDWGENEELGGERERVNGPGILGRLSVAKG